MENLLLVEAAHGGPFVFKHRGETYRLPSPVDMPFQYVLSQLQRREPPRPSDRMPAKGTMPKWKHDLLFEQWAAHYDLPDFKSAQRLAYLIDHYREAIVYDLYHFCSGTDLGELWRSRRWRTALDLIDRLPAHSWYSAAVSNDEDHARMLAESLIARKELDDESSSDKGPPLTSWTPEVAKLTEVVDAVSAVHHAIIAVNSEKGKVPDPPKPSPRPTTPLERAMKRANYEVRKERHEALARRMLPHKR